MLVTSGAPTPVKIITRTVLSGIRFHGQSLKNYPSSYCTRDMEPVNILYYAFSNF